MDSIFSNNSQKDSVRDVDKRRIVLDNLSRLNSNLPPKNRLSLVLFIYSDYSKTCTELLKSLPDECRNLFYYISIDSKKVRDRVLNTQRVKIKMVPSIICVDAENTVSTFEGEKTLEIIKTLYSVIKSGGNSTTTMGNSTTTMGNSTTTMGGNDSNGGRGGGVTSIYPRRAEENIPSHHNDAYGNNIMFNDTETMDSSGSEKYQNRKKLSHVDSSQSSNVGISTLRNKPQKGKGHEKMAHSSLSMVNVENDDEKYPSDIMDNIQGGELLDDVDMFDNEEEDEPVHKSIDKKDSMDNIKKAALEMQKMRESERDGERD